MALTNAVESRFMLTDLTGVVEQLPNQYGYINSLNLFTPLPTTQTTFVLDIEKHDISLLDPVSRLGKKAESQKGTQVSQIAFPLITFKDVESITPEEIQGVRQAGTVATPETEARLRARKLQKVRARFDITKEFFKMQALKGKVVDANGNVYLDLFGQFGVTQFEVDFDFKADAAAIDAQIELLKRHMEDNAQIGSLINGEAIQVIVDEKFFTNLVSSAALRDAYLQQQTALSYQQMTGSLRTGGADGVQRNMNRFTYRGVTFVQYNGQFKGSDGQPHKLVEDKTGYAFPDVSMLPGNDLFQIAYAPCAKMGYANTPGQELYVFEYERDRDEGVDFEAHSILMPFCTRPQLLVKLNDKTA